MTKMSKGFLRSSFLFLLSTLLILSFVLSANAVVPINPSDDTNGVVTRTLNVTEYDFTTNTERTYDIVYRVIFDDVEEEIMSITPPDEPPALSNDIIDDDTREQIPVSYYNEYPYNAVCELALKKGNKIGAASAFLVGNRIALTAAHCVYSQISPNSAYSWNDSVRIMAHPLPSLNPEDVYSRGVNVSKAIIPTSFKTNPNYDDDWAILVLEEGLGNANGTLSLSPASTTVNSQVHILGYPGDLRGMWRSDGIILDRTGRVLTYTCDTYEGNSGGPVYVTAAVNGQTTYKVVAIHSSGPDEPDENGNYYNQGVLINQFIRTEVARLNGLYQ